MSEALLPYEDLVLTIAASQSGRGDPTPPNTTGVLVGTIERLVAEVERLRAALAPLVAAYDMQDRTDPDDEAHGENTAGALVKRGDVRRAAALLNQEATP